jgi:hypothetical protein
MFPISSTNEEKVLVSINPTTAAGNPATVDGVPTWTVVTALLSLVLTVFLPTSFQVNLT